MRAGLFLVLAWLIAFPAGAADLVVGPRAQVASVVDGDTVVLDRAIDGADQVRLVGLQAPKIALGRAGFKDWPLGGEAKAALSALVIGKQVELRFGGRRMDRHGRHLAHLFLDDGTWVQGEMLRTGMARVYSFTDNRARVNDMLALETRARMARRGIWGHPFYAVRASTPTADLMGMLGTFQLIEGRVQDAALVKGTTYLNFGADWRTDFTARVPRRAAELFRKAGVDLLTLKGQTLRVRGWLDQRNGPEIVLSHPEQIEVLK